MEIVEAMQFYAFALKNEKNCSKQGYSIIEIHKTKTGDLHFNIPFL